MSCRVCRADLGPEARVCFNCETVLPGEREDVVAMIRESAEQDDFARSARTGKRHGPDSLAHEYAALDYADYQIHELPWEHPYLAGDMGFKEYVRQSAAWYWGWLQFLFVMLVLIFVGRGLYAWLT